MADAPGHLLGQLIGGLLEMATEPMLRALCAKHDLFLDVKGVRPGIRDGQLLALLDSQGNRHDLDFVIERGSVAASLGSYAAFIECAWRRYTKHSKAKAQEIQGAVLPLVSRWSAVGPTPAAVVAGQWSRPSIKQLESVGFVVLQLDFDTTVELFADFGIDIKGRDKVPDTFWQKQVDRLKAMSDGDLSDLANALRQRHIDDFRSFVDELEARVIRTVKRVIFYPVHGQSYEFLSIDDALAAVRTYDPLEKIHPFVRFEFEVIYTNGDTIKGSYSTVDASEEFLKKLR